MTKKWMLLALVVLTVWVLPVGLLDQPAQAQFGPQYACYDDDSLCQAILGHGCPTGTRCAVTAQPSGFYNCCLSGQVACVTSCDWHFSSCNTFCPPSI